MVVPRCKRGQDMNVSRIYRLLRELTLLQSGRSYTASQLAAELQVSKRTIFRDLNAMEMARIPYYYDPASKGYRISRHFFLPPVNLTLPESLALLGMAGGLQKETNIPLFSQGARAAAKIESVLPEAIRQHVGSVIDKLSLRLGAMAKHDGVEENFDLISGAIIQQKICKIKYGSFFHGKDITATVHPLKQVFIQRAWYLLAWSVSDKAIRTYKLIRIKSLKITDSTFVSQHEKMIEKHFGLAWSMIPEGKIYKVHIHFSPKVAGNVAEVQWHKTQQVKWNKDKSIEFYADVDGINEITWWLLGYGDMARVVTPKILAKSIANIAKGILDNYSPDSAKKL